MRKSIPGYEGLLEQVFGYPWYVREGLDEAQMRLDVERAVRSIRGAESAAVRFRFGLDRGGLSRTLKEVAAGIGVTPAQAGNLCAKGLRMLRHPIRSRALRQYVETGSA